MLKPSRAKPKSRCRLLHRSLTTAPGGPAIANELSFCMFSSRAVIFTEPVKGQASVLFSGKRRVETIGDHPNGVKFSRLAE
eukprot:7578656-Pyramimonas_sp.AAC.1